MLGIAVWVIKDSTIFLKQKKAKKGSTLKIFEPIKKWAEEDEIVHHCILNTLKEELGEEFFKERKFRAFPLGLKRFEIPGYGLAGRWHFMLPVTEAETELILSSRKSLVSIKIEDILEAEKIKLGEHLIFIKKLGIVIFDDDESIIPLIEKKIKTIQINQKVR